MKDIDSENDQMMSHLRKRKNKLFSTRGIPLDLDYVIKLSEAGRQTIVHSLRAVVISISTPTPKMEYGPIPPSKFDAVIEHLRRSFPDEPLNASVGLSVHGQPCDVLEKYDLLTMQEGMSIMAVDTLTGEIAGVALNGTCRIGDVEKTLEEMKTIENIPYQRIFGLLNTTNKELDLFSKYGVDKIFDLRILSVDNKYRGRGLAKELFARSELIAEEHDFKLMKVDATSLFTQRICESFGLTVEKTVRYHDFRDENGCKIYNTESPHDFYKVMVKRLPSTGNNCN